MHQASIVANDHPHIHTPHLVLNDYPVSSCTTILSTSSAVIYRHRYPAGFASLPPPFPPTDHLIHRTSGELLPFPCHPIDVLSVAWYIRAPLVLRHRASLTLNANFPRFPSPLVLPYSPLSPLFFSGQVSSLNVLFLPLLFKCHFPFGSRCYRRHFLEIILLLLLPVMDPVVVYCVPDGASCIGQRGK
jgi:hypothetical protein